MVNSGRSEDDGRCTGAALRLGVEVKTSVEALSTRLYGAEVVPVRIPGA